MRRVPSPDQSSIEDLNLALRLYRRLFVRIMAIFVLGIAAVIGLAHLGTALKPPYGLYILGWDLMTWGMIVVVVLLVGVLWWDGRRIGRALNDPVLLASPIVGLMSGLGVVAQMAYAMDMEWSGFFGPLRPVRKR